MVGRWLFALDVAFGRDLENIACVAIFVSPVWKSILPLGASYTSNSTPARGHVSDAGRGRKKDGPIRFLTWMLKSLMRLQSTALNFGDKQHLDGMVDG